MNLKFALPLKDIDKTIREDIHNPLQEISEQISKHYAQKRYQLIEICLEAYGHENVYQVPFVEGEKPLYYRHRKDDRLLLEIHPVTFEPRGVGGTTIHSEMKYKWHHGSNPYLQNYSHMDPITLKKHLNGEPFE